MIKNTDIIALLDYTRLQENDDIDDVQAFCRGAHSPQGNVAAICVFPEYINIAKDIAPDIAVATVANFPTGNDGLSNTLKIIETVIAHGCDEVDVVLPYEKLHAGERRHVEDFLKRCRDNTPAHVLKVIIESGELDSSTIKLATQLVIDSGADFVKTSTGKTPNGASIEAATIILNTIHHAGAKTGLKVSGGIRTRDTALDYIQLAIEKMGSDWLTPKHFRIGASSLLSELLSENG